MLYFEMDNKAYCFNCNKWIEINDIYLPDGSENEGRLNHLKCDTTVGYTFDKEWLNMIEINCGYILE